MVAQLGMLCCAVICAPTDPTQLEDAALTARSSLTSGHVVISGKSVQGNEEVAVRYDVTFAGRRIRCVFENSRAIPVGGQPTTWLKSTVIRAADRTFKASHAHDASGNPTIVVIQTRPPFDDTWVDPRMLGMTPHLSFGDDRLDFIVGRADRTSTKQSLEEPANGLAPLTRVDYVRKDGMEVSMWFDPQCGGSIAKMVLVDKKGRIPLRETLTCKLRQFGEVWFPEELVFEQRRNSDVLLRQELRVTHAEFKMPIEEATFSAAGLGLAPGRLLVELPENRDYLWDGKELKPRTGLAVDVSGASPSSPGMNVWLLIALVLAVLAAVVFIYPHFRAAKR